jgi:sulfoxide reductase heme-binding subunit YedZ
MTLTKRLPFWLLFSLPAILLTFGFLRGATPPQEMLHPSGEMAIRMMVAAMLPGPLIEFFGPNRFLRGWIALRRNFGVIGFIYALLHLIFYVADKATLAAVLSDLPQSAIWTGWLGLVLLVVPAAISFDAAVRALGRRWKRLQQVAYGALLFSIVHWVLLEWRWLPALAHMTPLLVAWALRAMARSRRQKPRSASA